MKKLLFLLLILPFLGNSQATFTAPVGYNTGAPTATPSGVGTRWRFDLLTGKKYTWLPGSLSWDEDARGIDQVAGCSAPLYTPGYNQSTFAVNSCTVPELYQWTGAAWVQLNEGAVYTAGTGISIDGSNVITNTAPNVVQTLSIAGQDLTLSNGGGTVAIPGGSSLGTGFTSGGGTGTIPAGTSISVVGDLPIDNGGNAAISIGDVNGSGFGLGMRMGDVSFEFGNLFGAGSYTIATYYDSDPENRSTVMLSPAGSLLFKQDFVQFTDASAGQLGIQYAADYSATIAANPRSIPDVGTVEQIIAAENGALGTGFVNGGGDGTLPLSSATLEEEATFDIKYFNDLRALNIDDEQGLIELSSKDGNSQLSFGNVGVAITSPLSAFFGPIKLPSLTTAQRNALSGVTAGTTIYNTDATATDSSTGVMQVYNGSTWKNAW